MKGFYSAVFLTVCTHVFLVPGIENRELQYCFHFTWPGAVNKNLNCANHTKDNPFTPCFEPLYSGDTKPNVTEIWNNQRKNFTTPLESSSVCVRYTYMYNGKVVNVSYFDGRVIADQTTPVIAGCYVQYTEGYIIEACACKDGNSLLDKDSIPPDMPCNSTRRNTHSSLIIFVAAAVSLFMYKIFEIFEIL